MTLKKLWMPALFGFVFLFIFDYLFHDRYMADLYAQTPDLWRSDAAAGDLMHWHVIALIVVSLALAWLFKHGYQGWGFNEGLRFGLAVGLFFAAMGLCLFTWLPVSQDVALNWVIGGLLKGLGLGIAFALAYTACGCGKSACDSGVKSG